MPDSYHGRGPCRHRRSYPALATAGPIRCAVGVELRPRALRPLPLGAITPTGWLRHQLQLQADGMAGHLDEFWPDVADSAWIGGSAEGWERAPYWLDGVIPLAAVLGDDRLTAKVRRWVDHIVSGQHVDGWLGPMGSPAAAQFGPYDVWPRMVLLKALLQYRSATGDERIVPCCLRLCRRIDEILAEWPLYEWGRARWADLVLSLDELHELTGEPWLPEMAERVRGQGYDWLTFSPHRGKVTGAVLREFQQNAGGHWANDGYLATHGVNIAMGLRAFPIWSRHTGADPAGLRRVLDELARWHGQATGLFTADEHLAGTSPAQGTETCAVVEFLYSLAAALETWGPLEDLAELWERLAFNALPASARSNECGHQYDQQANQVVCHVTEDRIYTNNGPDANIFGLEPHFGCCTANRHQGWPKFAGRLWMRSADDGLTALSYAPCRVDTQQARINVTGDYPFGERIRIVVDGTGEFPIHLRIPGWAHNATVEVDGAGARAVAGEHTLARDWSGHHVIELLLPSRIRAVPRPGGAVAVMRGPIVYALAVAEDWRQIGGTEPYGDWEVHPASPWNYSLHVDPADPERTLEVASLPIRDTVFSPDNAPVRIRAKARRIPEWGMEHGAAAAPPEHDGAGPSTEVTLLPYGAARLRVTDLPWHAE